MTANPYASPKTVALVNNEVDQASMRHQHARIEADMRGVGLLYYFAGTLVLISGVITLLSFFFLVDNFSAYSIAEMIGTAIVILMGGLLLMIGRGHRVFKPWSRIAGIICSLLLVLGLFAGLAITGIANWTDVGAASFWTAINGLILYRYFSAAGRQVFSHEYAEAVAATPHIKLRTSPAIMILLVLLVALFGLIIYLEING